MMYMPTVQNAVSLFEEMVAYEALLAQEGETLKTISRRLRSTGATPSALAKATHLSSFLREKVMEYLQTKRGFSVLFQGAFQYPEKLRDAEDPVAIIYAKGDLGLLESPSISIVGTRKASPGGRKRAIKLSRELVDADLTIVSGLATGIDTEALTAAIESGGRVIGVIGTPIDEYYPKENRGLQDEIARNHLLISQVPFFRYKDEAFKMRRFYFPMRNVTMAALSLGTVIVEASETSGTMTQARACLQQGRKLFVLESCFEDPQLTWPLNYEKRGAIRVRTTEDILEHIPTQRLLNALPVEKT
jgi:DNA processing protein